MLQTGLPPLFLIEGDSEIALQEAESIVVQLWPIAKDPAELAPIWPDFTPARQTQTQNLTG